MNLEIFIKEVRKDSLDFLYFYANLSPIHSLVYKLQCLKATNLRIFCKDKRREFLVLIKHYFLRGLLTIDQQRIRVTTSEQNLAYFNRNPKEFLRRFVTMGETWIHHYTAKSREGSKQWVKPRANAPKRPKAQQSI